MKHLLFSFYILIGVIASSQAQDESQDALMAGNPYNSIAFPKSPEAQAFEKYGNYTSDLYTGKPNIQIPLFNVEGKEISLPIVLDYDASGIKVEQVASTVGLGWNLKAGGRITRITNGSPDASSAFTPASAIVRDKMKRYSSPASRIAFSTSQELDNYLIFLKEVGSGKLDTQLDYYSVNVGPINDYIVFDLVTYQPRALINPRIKVNAEIGTGGIINSWTIIDEDGTLYTFGKTENSKEIVHTISDDASTTSYNFNLVYYSSWCVNRIESKNKTDVFEFEYSRLNWNQNSFFGSNIASKTIRLRSDSSIESTVDNWNTVLNYSIKQPFITKISKGNEILVFNYSPREDILFETNSSVNLNIGNRLTSISHNINDKQVNTYELKHSYFGYFDKNKPLTQNFYKKRLKLDTLVNYGSRNDLSKEAKKFSFDYFAPNSVPQINSNGQDYLGLYNGSDGNTSLIGRYDYQNVIIPGANRKPNFLSALSGTLKKINFPTGGSSEFFYEKNQVNNPNTTISTKYVTYGSCSVNGGIGNREDTSSGVWDAIANFPMVKTVVFDLQDSDLYDVFQSNGGYAFLNKITSPLATTAFSLIDPYSTNPSYFNYNSYDSSGLYTNGPKVYLEKGKYQVTLINSNIRDPSSVLSFSLSRTFNEERTLPVAGFRVKKIINTPSISNDGINIKQYEYSLGRQMTSSKEVNLEIFKVKESVPKEGSCDLEINSVLTLSNVRQESQPHVVYTEVKELSNCTDCNALYPIGFKKHYFKAKGTGIISVGDGKAKLYNNSYSAGKAYKTEIYDSSELLKQVDSLVYDDDIKSQVTGSFFSSYTGFYPVQMELGNQKYLVTYRLNEKYYYTHLDAIWLCRFNGDPSSCCLEPVRPTDSYVKDSLPANATEITIINDMGGYSSYLIAVGFTGKYGNLIAKHSKQFIDAGEPLKTSVEYTYSPENHFLLKQKTLANTSTGENILTKYYYPSDYAYAIPPNSLYTTTSEIPNTMLQRNEKNTVLRTESYIGTQGSEQNTLSTTEQKYNQYGGKILLSANSTWKKDYFSKRQETWYEHDLYGNLTEVYDSPVPSSVTEGLEIKKTEKHSLTSVIWGYSNKYPIAKVVNATYAEIMVLPAFANFNSGDGGLTQQQEEQLRSSLPQAMVTSYTYDPLIGVTSMTDPKGYTTYYEYDGLNRLKEVKDAEGNILSRNEYNYKGN